MRTNALPSSARKNSCVLHGVRPGAFDVRKRASLRQLCLGLKLPVYNKTGKVTHESRTRMEPDTRNSARVRTCEKNTPPKKSTPCT